MKREKLMKRLRRGKLGASQRALASDGLAGFLT